MDLNRGPYSQLQTLDERNLAAANSAIFLVCYYLVQLGYFLGLSKSILCPAQVVPYLGFLSDSARQAFGLIPAKKEKFLSLVRQILSCSTVSVKTLQRLVGKCVSFSLAVPGALLFKREMNLAISKGMRTHRLIKIDKNLRDEIAHWLFLETWDDPIPWRDERHMQISLASDASGSGWGASVILHETATTSDYWTDEEKTLDIASREALALDKALASFSDLLRNAWVEALVDNKAVVNAWSNQGGRSASLNRMIKRLFFTTAQLNISLHISYVASGENPADVPSRRLSILDNKLHPRVWSVVQREFGGPFGHTCDLMALDSNVMCDLDGNPLPHFSPYPTPASCGVNLFAQDLCREVAFLDRPYLFPPLPLVGPVLSFISSQKKNCTLVSLITYPKKYWWPLLKKYSSKSVKLADKGDQRALLIPSKDGWVPHSGIPGDLWAFSLKFV